MTNNKWYTFKQELKRPVKMYQGLPHPLDDLNALEAFMDYLQKANQCFENFEKLQVKQLKVSVRIRFVIKLNVNVSDTLSIG